MMNSNSPTLYMNLNSPTLSSSTNVSGPAFVIKLELFEHGVFPTPSKLSFLSVNSLFKSLNLVADIDNKVTLDQFRDSTAKYIPSLALRDSETYFMIFKILSENAPFAKDMEPQSYSQLNAKKTTAAKTPNSLKADARTICLFMFLQLYSSHLRHNLDKSPKDINISWTSALNSQFNESIRGAQAQNYMNSPINSPRAKTARSYTTNEYNSIHYFIKSNIRAILNFISNDVKGDDALSNHITENEFNLLEFLFSPDQNSNPPLSRITNLFTSSPKTTLQNAADWLSNRMIVSDTSNALYIQALNKSVTVKDASVCRGKDIRIIGCEESYIYIKSNVRSVSISNCSNSTIFIGAVSKICSVEKCENLNITVAASILRIGNTIDSTFNFYGVLNPVIYGDSRSIITGPYNANFQEFKSYLDEAGIPVSFKYIQSYDNPVVLNATENTNADHKIQKIEDYSTLTLPEGFFRPMMPNEAKGVDPLFFGLNQKSNVEDRDVLLTNATLPMLCPNAYRDQIKRRFLALRDFSADIKNMKLGEEQEKLLHFAIQAQFKDWLTNSGSIKPVLDMLKVLDKE